MCQLCEEATLYMAQPEAAERKAAEAKAQGDGGKTGGAAGKPVKAAADAGAK